MEILSVSRGTVFNLLAEGKLAGHKDKPGRNGIRITVKSVEDCLEGHPLAGILSGPKLSEMIFLPGTVSI